MPQSVADAKPSSNHRDAAPTSKHRDGFAELSAQDQPNMARRAALFQGVKLGAEYAGMRPLRHTLHLDPSTAPPGAKLVYLLRHGEGVHNVWRHAEQAAGRTPTAKRHNQHRVPAGLHDPVLTSQGLADAAAAAELARALPRPQLCVCSPMRRTTQTLLVAFGDAVAAGVPVVAHELCREAFHGRDPSLYDSRLPAAELSSAFPQVDFHTHVLPAEETPAAQAHPGGVGSHPERVGSHPGEVGSHPEAPGSHPGTVGSHPEGLGSNPEGVGTQPKMPASIGDPLWWHCVSPYARSADSPNGMDEAANPNPDSTPNPDPDTNPYPNPNPGQKSGQKSGQKFPENFPEISRKKYYIVLYSTI